MEDKRVAEGHRIAEKLNRSVAPAAFVLIVVGALVDRSFDGILTYVIVGIFFMVLAYGVTTIPGTQ